jgi:hypothetical protein
VTSDDINATKKALTKHAVMIVHMPNNHSYHTQFGTDDRGGGLLEGEGTRLVLSFKGSMMA